MSAVGHRFHVGADRLPAGLVLSVAEFVTLGAQETVQCLVLHPKLTRDGIELAIAKVFDEAAGVSPNGARSTVAGVC
jgi:hypothetical protein